VSGAAGRRGGASRGTLYVVGTPLGNLGDLSPRAAETLRQASVVAAEDTRRTRGLLSHLGAAPALLSFHAHSSERRLETLLEILGDGRDVALVTDAGTPGVSDPGTDLVAAALDAGFAVVPIPGPSAVATALSAAGVPADRYLFLGFVPRKGAERSRLLARAAAEEWSVVLFEAPTRLVALLGAPMWSGLLHQAFGVLTFALLSRLMWRAVAPAPASVEEPAHVGLSRA